jgi:iron complex outermembrane receptor protein
MEVGSLAAFIFAEIFVMFRHLFIILPSTLFTISLTAQERALDTIVITSSLQAQHERETGRNMVTIHGSELRKLPVTSVDEVLRYLPGVEVQQRGPQGSQADIIIRGGTFQQVLVMIDGVRLNDPLTGHFNGYIPLHLSEIERIEILKGAAASIHGSDAIGGVINILTKTARHSDQEQKHAWTAGWEAGQFGLLNADAWWRMRGARTSVSAGLFRQHADGQQLRGTRGFFDNRSVSVALGHQFNERWRMSFRTAADLRDFNAQNFYTTFASDTAREKVDAYWQQLQVSGRLKGFTLHADAAFKMLEDVYSFRPAVIPNQNRTRQLVTQVYGIVPAGKRTTFTTGVQFIEKRIRSNDRGNHDLPHAAAYVVATHRLPFGLHLNESLRYDWDGNYGSVLVPQVNASWTAGRVTLRASSGKGIRDADFTERYNNYNKSVVSSGSIGNPDLRTERSWSHEAGADYRVASWFKMSATVFRRDQRDLIDWTPTPYAQMPRKSNLVQGATYALATNLSSVQTSGFELDMRVDHRFGERNRLLVMAGLLWLRSEDADKTPSFYISSHARFLFNSTVALTAGPFDLSLQTLYKRRNVQTATAISSQLDREYFLMNAKVRYQILKIRTSLFVQSYNLFDRSFSDLLGARMPGRWVSFGMQFGR